MNCAYCNKELTSQQKKFCSSSCSAKFNNAGRVRTEASKLKTATSIEKFYVLHPERQAEKTDRLIKWSTSRVRQNEKPGICTVCGKSFTAKRISKGYFTRVCSDECFILRKRQNAKGIKRTVYCGITFDSKWEAQLAEWLDENSIKWEIPTDAILWNDSTGRVHRYYPDFYLPDYITYLDPKNPIVVSLQKEKLDIVTKQIPLIYGSLEYIKQEVVRLPRVERRLADS
jgi:predicted nucleic acid-binding Zn ribbon protein